MRGILRLGSFLLASLPLAGPVLAGESAAGALAIRVFAQADGPVLPLARRLYSTHFDALRTPALGVEVFAALPPRKGPTDIAVSCSLQLPDGSRLPGGVPVTLALAAGGSPSHGAALPWSRPGDDGWPAGTYVVRCGTDEMASAEAAFDMTVNPADVAETDIRVVALRLFPVERELPAMSDRRYAGTFAAAETRHIGVELEFTHAPLGRAMTIPVDCYYFWPDGQTSPPVLLRYEPQATWPGGYSAGAIGWEQPGHWLPGVYTVTCLIQGRPVIVDRFDVT